MASHTGKVGIGLGAPSLLPTPLSQAHALLGTVWEDDAVPRHTRARTMRIRASVKGHVMTGGFTPQPIADAPW